MKIARGLLGPRATGVSLYGYWCGALLLSLFS